MLVEKVHLVLLHYGLYQHNFCHVKIIKKQMKRFIIILVVLIKIVLLLTISYMYIRQKQKNVKIKYYCINLERRQDRKDSMLRQFSEQKIDVEFVQAVDGKLLEPSDELKELFRDNDFHYRRGVIGCAMSHINLWKQIVASDSSEPVCIFEDDSVLIPNYSSVLQSVLKKLPKDTDVLFLSYHTHHTNHIKNIEKIDVKLFDETKYIGGTHNYIITKQGAKKMLQILSTNGIQNAIDIFMKKQCKQMNMYETTSFLCKSDWVQTIDSNVDSDIQLISDSLFSDESNKSIESRTNEL